MRTIYAFVLLLTSTIACVADSALKSVENPDVARGFMLVKVNCSSCHAVGMDGNSPHREAPPFRVVMKSYPAESLSEALAEGLVTGHPDMPEFVFAPEDVGAIVSYLHTLEGLQ
jgi:cytochrome c